MTTTPIPIVIASAFLLFGGMLARSDFYSRKGYVQTLHRAGRRHLGTG